MNSVFVALNIVKGFLLSSVVIIDIKNQQIEILVLQLKTGMTYSSASFAVDTRSLYLIIWSRARTHWTATLKHIKSMYLTWWNIALQYAFSTRLGFHVPSLASAAAGRDYGIRPIFGGTSDVKIIESPIVSKGVLGAFIENQKIL